MRAGRLSAEARTPGDPSRRALNGPLIATPFLDYQPHESCIAIIEVTSRIILATRKGPKMASRHTVP
jgi:hypothetical protein